LLLSLQNSESGYIIGVWKKQLNIPVVGAKDKFADTIKAAKQRVEAYAEEQLYRASAQAGPIFALKNFGWSDKSSVEMTGKDGKDLFQETEVELDNRIKAILSAQQGKG
jgi:hypothetical protein